jgi:hypothetical protein
MISYSGARQTNVLCTLIGSWDINILWSMNCYCKIFIFNQGSSFHPLNPSNEEQNMGFTANNVISCDVCVPLMPRCTRYIIIRVIAKLPNSEQSYKGKVKTHNYINRQNQSTTGKL